MPVCVQVEEMLMLPLQPRTSGETTTRRWVRQDFRMRRKMFLEEVRGRGPAHVSWACIGQPGQTGCSLTLPYEHAQRLPESCPWPPVLCGHASARVVVCWNSAAACPPFAQVAKLAVEGPIHKIELRRARCFKDSIAVFAGKGHAVWRQPLKVSQSLV